MTYEETVLSMVRLMYVSHQNRWVDLSLRNLADDWLRCIEERSAGVNGGGQIPSILQSFTSLDQTIHARSLRSSSRSILRERPSSFPPRTRLASLPPLSVLVKSYHLAFGI